MDCLSCELRGQCLGRGAKGTRARRVSAVRRLLPSSASVERPSPLLRAIRWVDVAGRALRRTWMAHGRRQGVEVLPLVEMLKPVSPPPRPPRVVRSHDRWSWSDRFARNAWWGAAATTHHGGFRPCMLCQHVAQEEPANNEIISAKGSFELDPVW